MKQILVVLTSSPDSRAALDEAITLAKETGGRLCLMRIVSWDMPSLARTQAWLDRMEQRVPPELRNGAVALAGPAPLAIDQAVFAYESDLVVFGASAYGALLRLGPDASFKARLAQKLLVVRRRIDGSVTRSPARPCSREGSTRGPAPMDGALVGSRRIEGGERFAGARALMRRDHARLEQICDALRTARNERDWAEVRAEWDLFVPALRRHVTMDEHRVLPLVSSIDPEEVAVLRAEHDEIRARLDEIGIHVERHAFNPSRLAALIERVRAHGRREIALFYPRAESGLLHRAGWSRPAPTTQPDTASRRGRGRSAEHSRWSDAPE